MEINRQPEAGSATLRIGAQTIEIPNGIISVKASQTRRPELHPGPQLPEHRMSPGKWRFEIAIDVYDSDDMFKVLLDNGAICSGGEASI